MKVNNSPNRKNNYSYKFTDYKMFNLNKINFINYQKIIENVCTNFNVRNADVKKK